MPTQSITLLPVDFGLKSASQRQLEFQRSVNRQPDQGAGTAVNHAHVKLSTGLIAPPGADRPKR